jgi:STAM-binding protein
MSGDIFCRFLSNSSSLTGFMSSVDLHTHSGFQRMLPESFAVVCAPKSTPKYSLLNLLDDVLPNSHLASSFGIFRLTDPPGLKTVLECTAKEAFHPHPDLPIYTVRLCIPLWLQYLFADFDRHLQDADKGHVQMKDMSLEIVDLR